MPLSVTVTSKVLPTVSPLIEPVSATPVAASAEPIWLLPSIGSIVTVTTNGSAVIGGAVAVCDVVVVALASVVCKLTVCTCAASVVAVWLLLPLGSVKTVVDGGALGSTGGLPTAAVLVEAVFVFVLLFGAVFSVCCGRFGNCTFPVS